MPCGSWLRLLSKRLPAAAAAAVTLRGRLHKVRGCLPLAHGCSFPTVRPQICSPWWLQPLLVRSFADQNYLWKFRHHAPRAPTGLKLDIICIQSPSAMKHEHGHWQPWHDGTSAGVGPRGSAPPVCCPPARSAAQPPAATCTSSATVSLGPHGLPLAPPRSSWVSSPAHAPTRHSSAGGRAGLGAPRDVPRWGRACARAAADRPRRPHCSGSCAGPYPQPGSLPPAPRPPPAGFGARALCHRHLCRGRCAMLHLWGHSAVAIRAGWWPAGCGQGLSPSGNGRRPVCCTRLPSRAPMLLESSGSCSTGSPPRTRV